jgi:cytochrome c-type biogenesis protein CcmE
MSFLPKSRKARRRLTVLAVAAPVVALAVGLALWGMRDAISLFYTPAQAAAAHVPAGRKVQLGGLVKAGSVVKHPDGLVEFVVADQRSTALVRYQGDLPDLFREGQGIVASGAFDESGPSSPSRCWPSTTSATCRARSPRPEGTGRVARRRRQAGV